MKSSACVGKISGKPLTEYRSAAQAQEAARYESRQGSDMIHYHCSVCGKYHLAPANRQTPSKRCTECDKEGYATQGDAQRRASILRKEKQVRLWAYPCPYQNGWHLTRSRQR